MMVVCLLLTPHRYRPAIAVCTGQHGQDPLVLVTAIIIAGSAITAITSVVVSNVTSTIAAVNTAIGSANTSGTATPLVSHVCIVVSCILI